MYDLVMELFYLDVCNLQRGNKGMKFVQPVYALVKSKEYSIEKIIQSIKFVK